MIRVNLRHPLHKTKFRDVLPELSGIIDFFSMNAWGTFEQELEHVNREQIRLA